MTSKFVIHHLPVIQTPAAAAPGGKIPWDVIVRYTGEICQKPKNRKTNRLNNAICITGNNIKDVFKTIGHLDRRDKRLRKMIYIVLEYFETNTMETMCLKNSLKTPLQAILQNQVVRVVGHKYRQTSTFAYQSDTTTAAISFAIDPQCPADAKLIEVLYNHAIYTTNDTRAVTFGYTDQFMHATTGESMLKYFSHCNMWSTERQAMDEIAGQLRDIYIKMFGQVMAMHETSMYAEYIYTHDPTISVENQMSLLQLLNSKQMFLSTSGDDLPITTHIGSGGIITPLRQTSGFRCMADLLVAGGPRLWLVVSPDYCQRLADLMEQELMMSGCRNPLLHGVYIVDPNFLLQHNIPFEIVVQKIGDVIIMREFTHYQVINVGISASEVVHYDSHEVHAAYQHLFNQRCNCPNMQAEFEKFRGPINPAEDTVTYSLLVSRQRPLVCSVCKSERRSVPFVHRNPKRLEEHINQEHGGVVGTRIFKCDIDNCQKTYKNKHSLRDHQITHENYGGRCIFCQQSFQQVFRHMRRVHNYTVDKHFVHFNKFRRAYIDYVAANIYDVQGILDEEELLTKHATFKQEIEKIQAALVVEYPQLKALLDATSTTTTTTKKYIRSEIKKLQAATIPPAKLQCDQCKRSFVNVYSKNRHVKNAVCTKNAMAKIKARK